MTIPPDFLDELRGRVALSSVVGRRVKLQRAGREFKACCPFHNEKTPSFTVNDEKGFYHCFGCGAHGDVVRFVIEQEGLPFRDAVERLAAEAGLAMPDEERGDVEARQRRSGLHDIMAHASGWFQEQLNGIAGAEARAYQDRRGPPQQARDAFGLGFAPDARGKLKAALAQAGTDRLIELGLLIDPDGEREAYDRFRGRLMFPIRDPRARIIGFGGRIIGSGEPKYLNSPDTPLFDKGRTLYNLDRAAPSAHKSGRLVVAEGYMDVIALDLAGIPAVAPLGTALTEAQMELLWRQVDVPLLCFDGDSAGQRAAARAALRALPLLKPGKSLAFITLPPGQDPDDLIRAGGAAAMEALLGSPQPLDARIWAEEFAARPLDTPEARAGLRQRLRAHVGEIADPDVRQGYAASFDERFQAAFQRTPRANGYPQRREGNWRGAPTRDVTLDALKARGSRSPTETAFAALIAGGLERPPLFVHHAEALAALPLADERLTRLRGALFEAVATAPHLDKASLQHTLDAAGVGALAKEVRRGIRLAYSFTRTGGDDARAEQDFVHVLEALVARSALDLALAEATARFRASLGDADYVEQQRVLGEREAVDARLRALARRDDE